MNNTIRVTVVATGLGQGLRLVQPTEQPAVTQETIVPRNTGGANEAPDYRGFDRPPVERQQQRAVGHDVADSPEDLDLLDIPAFLRRQAD
jgi:cell division protein FtsZ